MVSPPAAGNEPAHSGLAGGRTKDLLARAGHDRRLGRETGDIDEPT
jgi:hypothetical protein